MNFAASPILMSNLTSSAVNTLIESGWDRVVVTSGSIEQHGPHLPLHTDYTLAQSLALKAAEKIGRTLVAPAIPIGCSDHHMSFPGTLTVPREVFIQYLENVGTSLIRHGFKTLLLTSFHGGNFEPSREVARRLKETHPGVEIKTALDLGKLLRVTNGVLHHFFPDRTALDCHAGCVETSMMIYLDENWVRRDQAEDGAQLSELPPFEDLKRVTKNGVIGLVSGYSAALGERLFEALVNFLIESWDFQSG